MGRGWHSTHCVVVDAAEGQRSRQRTPGCQRRSGPEPVNTEQRNTQQVNTHAGTSALDRFPEHRRVLEAIVTHYRDDPRVLGLLLGGSNVAGGMDVFSDVTCMWW